jgi:hypothetical protein
VKEELSDLVLTKDNSSSSTGVNTKSDGNQSRRTEEEYLTSTVRPYYIEFMSDSEYYTDYTGYTARTVNTEEDYSCDSTWEYLRDPLYTPHTWKTPTELRELRAITAEVPRFTRISKTVPVEDIPRKNWKYLLYNLLGAHIKSPQETTLTTKDYWKRYIQYRLDTGFVHTHRILAYRIQVNNLRHSTKALGTWPYLVWRTVEYFEPHTQYCTEVVEAVQLAILVGYPLLLHEQTLGNKLIVPPTVDVDSTNERIARYFSGKSLYYLHREGTRLQEWNWAEDTIIGPYNIGPDSFEEACTWLKVQYARRKRELSSQIKFNHEIAQNQVHQGTYYHIEGITFEDLDLEPPKKKIKEEESAESDW